MSFWGDTRFVLHWVSPSPTFPRGVIGNTAVFGTAILGSNPGGEADFCGPLTGVFAGWGHFMLLGIV